MAISFPSVQAPTGFHGSTKVWEYGTLATATTVKVVGGSVTNTFTFAANQRISFHANGVVSNGTLATASSGTKVVVGGVTNTFSLKSNSSISFHESGVLKEWGIYCCENSEDGGYSGRCHQHLFFYVDRFPR